MKTVTNPLKRYAPWLILLALNAAALFAGFYSASAMYINNKTDGHGNGSVRVAECVTEDADWKIYTCRGDYIPGAGAVFLSDVTARVTAVQYKSGEIIKDVYPAYRGHPGNTVPLDREGAPRHFITGLERSSVRHNIGWLALFFGAALVPLGSLVAIVWMRNSRRGVKNT